MDYFALLDQPRRPWLEPEVLRERFVALSSQVHPDRVHNASDEEKRAAHERYTDLNAAYQCLREPKERLRHLLELETGARPEQVQRVPAELMEIMQQVSEVCRKADSLLAEKAGLASPLLQVQLFERCQAQRERLTDLLQRIRGENEKALGALKSLDAEWEHSASEDEAGRQKVLAQMEGLYRLLSYFSRWMGQIQERVVRLSF
jgi:DnaJ-domain-containing protein 1